MVCDTSAASKVKKLVMIAGPAGVGKTTVCQRLFKAIDGCAWLDGDWCWMVNPYPGKTPEQKRYACQTFGRILDGYMRDDNTHTILFSWLIRADFMFGLVTEQLSSADYQPVKIALVCDEKEYVRRLTGGGRSEDKILRPDDMARYRALDAIVIDTTRMSVQEAADEVLYVINNGQKRA